MTSKHGILAKYWLVNASLQLRSERTCAKFSQFSKMVGLRNSMQASLTIGFWLQRPSVNTSILVSGEGKSLSWVQLAISWLKMRVHTSALSSRSLFPINASATSEYGPFMLLIMRFLMSTEWLEFRSLIKWTKSTSDFMSDITPAIKTAFI